MAKLFTQLLKVAKAAIISGGDWPQFEKQVLSRLQKKAVLKRLSILLTCGTKYYQYKSGWKKIVFEDFTADEKIRSLIILINVAAAGFKIEKTWGEQIEDWEARWSLFRH